MRARRIGRTAAAGTALALAALLSGCLGFGGSGGDDDEAPPAPPVTTLRSSVESRTNHPAYGTADTWQSGARARTAAEVPKGPLDKSPTAFPGPPAGGALPSLPGAPKPAATAAASAARPVQPPPPGVNAAADGVALLDAFRKDKVGALITRADDLYAERSAQLALEFTQDGAGRGWTNPETGTTGAVKPTRTFQQADGTYCREYVQSIQVRQKAGGDVKSQAEATGRFACRQPTGRWKFLP